MSGLPDKETGDQLSRDEIVRGGSCVEVFMITLLLGRREIPWCSDAFIEGVVTGTTGASL